MSYGSGVSIIDREIVAWATDYAGDPFDAVLCDPPYELAFMGRRWDSTGVAFQVATWQAIRRHLRPGAHLLAFGGTRTYHRLTCAIEDAGLEIRDCVLWLYGSGFPKSLDVSKAIDKAAGASRDIEPNPRAAQQTASIGTSVFGDYAGAAATISPVPATAEAERRNGYGSALKPAYEPVVLARNPLDGTIAATALEHGTGGLAIDACRVPMGGSRASGETSLGRWPANVIHDGSEEVVAHFPARFFYCAKASRSQREAGLRAFKKRDRAELTGRAAGSPGLEGANGNNPYTGANYRTPIANTHPTVKPIALTEYLARLILPPPRADGKPRRLLVPFAGSGSEMIGALRAGWDEVVGVERECEYVAIAEARINKEISTGAPDLFSAQQCTPEPKEETEPMADLFGAVNL